MKLIQSDDILLPLSSKAKQRFLHSKARGTGSRSRAPWCAHAPLVRSRAPIAWGSAPRLPALGGGAPLGVPLPGSRFARPGALRAPSAPAARAWGAPHTRGVFPCAILLSVLLLLPAARLPLPSPQGERRCQHRYWQSKKVHISVDLFTRCYWYGSRLGQDPCRRSRVATDNMFSHGDGKHTEAGAYMLYTCTTIIATSGQFVKRVAETSPQISRPPSLHT